METFKDIIEFISPFKWSIVFLITIYVFREPLKKIIERINIKSIKTVIADIEMFKGDHAKPIYNSNKATIEDLKLELERVNFNSNRALYFTFYFQANYSWSCIFALRSLTYFNGITNLNGVSHWLNNASKSYESLNPDQKQFFDSSFKDEAKGILNIVLDSEYAKDTPIIQMSNAFLKKLQSK